MGQQPKRGIKGIKTAMAIIESAGPLLMHNGLMADKDNVWAKKISAITSKNTKQKTDADGQNLIKYEFQGALYFDDDVGPFLPDYMIEACIRDGARINNKGKTIEAGLQVSPERVKLNYSGPRTRDGLFKDGGFIDRRPVKLSRSATIIRTRPRFNEWSAEFEIDIIEHVVSPKDVEVAIEKAGLLRCLGDYRPKFGRFFVKEFAWL